MTVPSPDVVVVANTGGGGGASVGGGSPIVTYAQYQTSSEAEDRPTVYHSNSVETGVTTQVTVHLDDQSHMQEALIAAEKVAKALNTIVAAAKALPANTDITMANGQYITAGKLLAYLEQDHFVITDHSYQSLNGGVGASDYAGGLGPAHTDYLDYSHFGSTGYGNSTYGDTGMVGIMLHELSHLTSEGYAVSTQEHAMYNREVAEKVSVRDNYDSSNAYWKDNEAFADTTAHDIGSALGLDTTHYFDHVTYDRTYMGAAALLADHGGW